MKKLVLTVLVTAFSATMVMASDPIGSPSQKLRQQIIELLETPEFEFESELIQARIAFTLNKEGKIVILTIDSENLLLENYIKGKLNYKKMLLNGLKVGSEFYIDFKVEKSMV